MQNPSQAPVIVQASKHALSSQRVVSSLLAALVETSPVDASVAAAAVPDAAVPDAAVPDAAGSRLLCAPAGGRSAGCTAHAAGRLQLSASRKCRSFMCSPCLVPRYQTPWIHIDQLPIDNNAV
jgi:hypothetical protein